MDYHRAEAEKDLAWRTEELNFIANLANSIDPKDQNKLHRTGITMMYAHYEGYAYFLFNLYVKHINQKRLRCHEVKPALATASLADVLHELRNTSRNPKNFTKNRHSEEIIQIARDTEFVENVSNILSKLLIIPDKAISVDSNLKLSVLKPILFRLGFSENFLDELSRDIDRLVNYRNTIAHGSRSKPISKPEYVKLMQTTIFLMTSLRDNIFESIESEAYIDLRPSFYIQQQNDFY